MRYETKYGQTLGIIGSIPELGSWKDPIKLTWHDDHQWKLREPLTPCKNHFTYKFVILNDTGKVAIWEAGIDRLADLDILPDAQTNSGFEPKRVVIHNVWEKILIKFTIFTPVDSSIDEKLWLN